MKRSTKLSRVARYAWLTFTQTGMFESRVYVEHCERERTNERVTNFCVNARDELVVSPVSLRFEPGAGLVG